MGLLIGAIEVFFLNRTFQQVSFGKKLFLKTSLYIGSMILFLVINTFFINAMRMGLPLFHPQVFQSLKNFFFHYVFWSIVLYASMIMLVSQFYSEVVEYVGSHVLKNFFLGTYHKPKEEERIFMFLDMKSSTTIAEKLGHERYFSLLNNYYQDLSEAIIDSSGQIYQYVGDEVIISWDLENGLRNNQCVECFFHAQKILESHRKKYESQYGLLPEFKAGVHFGPVTTGEIGVIKKEILFTGDVLNTTARIQESCKTYGRNLLLSGQLLDKIKNKEKYHPEELGEVSLRGREASLHLYALSWHEADYKYRNQ